MLFTETVAQSIKSVKANALRAVLTLLIIAFGIMALVGILTSIDALLFTMNDSLSRMGANSFDITPTGSSLRSSRYGRQSKRGKPIDFRQALAFKDRFDFPSSNVTVFGYATGNATLKYRDEKTNPTVVVVGIDNEYLNIKDYILENGRNFNGIEQASGTQVALIGMDIVNDLFDKKAAAAINSNITVDGNRFTVIGVLASKGSTMGQSADRRVLIPLFTERNLYGYANKNYDISVMTNEAESLEDALSMATGLMRNIRKLRAAEENDFDTRQSDSLMNLLKDNTVTIRLVTIGIGLITLLGAAIGLMNIMLVSVTERTREIGITKALGATRSHIVMQFLTEAIIICQLGGILGIILGILMGNGVALALGGNFIIPWAWIILGFITCLVVGLVSGLYPALKASRLDPIESLRYE